MVSDLISVILPVYNRESYLKKCIDSVLNQENVDLELILIDDGSTDGSPAICDDYASRYENVRVYHQENSGLSVVRNAGLDNASGEYIVFIDSDDFLPEGILAKMLLQLKENDADMVMGNYAEYDDEGNYIKQFPIPEKYLNKVLTKREACELLLFSGESHVLIVSWGKIFKKAVWDGLRFPDEVVKSEDQFVFPKLLENCKRIYFSGDTVYNQVFSKNSITRSNFSRKHLYHAEGVAIVLRYLMEQGFYDIALCKFGMGSRHLMDMKGVLKDPECKTELKRLYKIYRSLAFDLIPHVNVKNKLRLILFMCNFDLYKCVQRMYSN